MSKTPRRSRSELEHLRGQVKSLKSINRQLKKKLKEFERREHFHDNVINTAIELSEGDVDMASCEKCGKGVLQIVDLKYVKYAVCTICNDRSRVD